VHEIALALLFAFSSALTGLTASRTVGVLGVNSVNGTLSNGVEVLSNFLSSFEACSGALQ
jgi:hypothetical protein